MSASIKQMLNMCRLVLTSAHCVPEKLQPAQSNDFSMVDIAFSSFKNTYKPGTGTGMSPGR